MVTITDGKLDIANSKIASDVSANANGEYGAATIKNLSAIFARNSNVVMAHSDINFNGFTSADGVAKAEMSGVILDKSFANIQKSQINVGTFAPNGDTGSYGIYAINNSSIIANNNTFNIASLASLINGSATAWGIFNEGHDTFQSGNTFHRIAIGNITAGGDVGP